MPSMRIRERRSGVRQAHSSTHGEYILLREVIQLTMQMADDWSTA